MKKFLCYTALLEIAIASHPLAACAQITTTVGLVLKTDSTDNVLMPRIVQILPNTAAAAEPDIKVGMYVVKMGETYCRNAPLDKITNIINYGDEEGTPVALFISDEKDTFPKRPTVLRRGRSIPRTDQ
ncbi:MAG: hypothetical protein JWQ38_547 [Flavipsychrobacter sp.]|nr:hypothetical protein [Flavipsychrobacter sp.]